MAVDIDARTVAWAEGETPARLLLGERYELLGLLGAGGMGNVYRARDLELDELVALKVLRPELVGAAGALERFRLEVKLARRVTHPNVARVFDIGEHGGDKILTMELIDGEALSALLERRSALPQARAVEIAIAICNGVGAAHAAGVIHRDLKPDNVLLEEGGRVVVADFGIARAAAASDVQTGGALIGTPAYMAPEQVEGRLDVDERADVYAFGAMLFEMLTGARPWTGATVLAVAAARLLRDPPDPRTLRPELEPTLAELTLRCMARAAADRYPTMATVAEALRGALREAEDHGPPASEPPRDPGLLRRMRYDRHVAVLPFRNLGPAEHDYVADGVTEDLIDLLGVARGIRVQSSGVIMKYRGRDRDPREVGRELGVHVVVEGSVRGGDGKFRISARLVSVAEGFMLWSRRFEGSVSDVLALNDEVARAVAAALTVDLAPVVRDVGKDGDAADLYLRARAASHRFFTGDHVASASLFEKARAASPNDPRILAGYVLGRVLSPATMAAEVPELLAHAERAVALGPSVPDGHAALGAVLFHSGEAARAARALKRAVRLGPNSAEGHDFLGRMLSEAGRDEGRRHLEAALSLAPTLELAEVSLARHHALLGDWDRAMVHATFPAKARFALWRRDVDGASELLAQAARLQAGAGTIGAAIPRVAQMILEVAVGGAAPPEDFIVAHPEAKLRTRAFVAQLQIEIACAVGTLDRALARLAELESLRVLDVAWFEGCPLLSVVSEEPAFRAARASAAEAAAEVVAAYLAPEE